MKTVLEIFGRGIIGASNVILLVLGEPHIQTVIPALGPYSVHIMYTATVIIGMWVMNPFIEDLYGYSHTHKINKR